MVRMVVCIKAEAKSADLAATRQSASDRTRNGVMAKLARQGWREMLDWAVKTVLVAVGFVVVLACLEGLAG